MSHIPEGELALFAAFPDAVAPELRTDIERHLGGCAECQERHDFFAIRDETVSDELREPDTWEPSIASVTYASLMEYGARVAEEDREAEIVLKPFFANPVTAAWTSLTTKRRYLTGGVVRKLNAAAHDICTSKPRVALTFADAAISVAEALPKTLYPALAVYRLRGTAWKERANAHMLLGQLPEAHDALDRAERAYRKTPHNALGLSMVALVRAGVFYEQQRLDDATAWAETAERGFAHAGDEKRRMDAAFLGASIRFEAGRVHDAVTTFRRIVEHGENTGDADWIALGAYAVGNCEIERGNLNEASLQFHRALVIFRERGPERERLLTEWGLARVVLQSGRWSEAIPRLREVAAALAARGMVTNAALAGLDVAEALLALGRMKDIVPLAKHLFGVFTKAGMLTGALAAIAYLREAAAANRLTKDDLAAIRSFIRRAERQPSLVFAPPPPSSKDSV